MRYRSKDATNSGDREAAAAVAAAEQDEWPHPLANAQAIDLPPHAPSSSPQQHSGPSNLSASDTVAESSLEQQTGASEELVDLFASIEGLRQEVDALPDPASLTPASRVKPNAVGENQVSCTNLDLS